MATSTRYTQPHRLRLAAASALGVAAIITGGWSLASSLTSAPPAQVASASAPTSAVGSLTTPTTVTAASKAAASVAPARPHETDHAAGSDRG